MWIRFWGAGHLSKVKFPRRNTLSYLNETVYFNTKNISLKFYDKHAESGLDQAKGILRQEISYRNPNAVKRYIGAKTLAEISFYPMVRELNKAISIIGLDKSIIPDGKVGAGDLLNRFGLKEGIFNYGLLSLNSIYPISHLARMANMHSRTLARHLKKLAAAGYAPKLATGQHVLPPLSCDLLILDDKHAELHR